MTKHNPKLTDPFWKIMEESKDTTVNGAVDPCAPTIKIGADPLALIIKWREDGTDGGYCHSIDLLKEPALLTPMLTKLENRHLELAKTMRQHYQGKFVTAMLKQTTLSPFRKKLYKALELRNAISVDTIVALYKAVDFYYEDISMAKLLDGAVSIDIDINANRMVKDIKINDDCEYIGSTTKKNQRTRQKRYWFKNKNNNLCMFYIDPKCASVPVVDQYLVIGKKYCLESPNVGIIKVVEDDIFLAINLSNKYSITEVK